MEIDKKAKKIQDKIQKKLKIVEENVEITEAEKQTVYKKIKKQISKYQKSNNRNKNISDMLFKLSCYATGNDTIDNTIIGVCSSCMFFFSSISIAAGIVMGEAVATAIGGLTAAISGTFMANSIMNTEINGDSLISFKKQETVEKHKDIDNVLDVLNKQLNKLIKPQGLEMNR